MEYGVYIILLLVIGYLGVMNYIQNERAHKERKELLDRLMSRDYSDFMISNNVHNTEMVRPNESVENELNRLLDNEAAGIPVGS